MIVERNDLMKKLEGLTQRYDEAVREISIQRRQMERNNQEHTNMIAAQIIFTELEKSMRNRKREGLQEIRYYMKFDHDIKEKLKGLAAHFDRTGSFKLREALSKWWRNTLKPIQARKSSKLLAMKGRRDCVKQKYFYVWRGLFQERLEAYNRKSEALHLMWSYKKKDSALDLQRAFAIWKGFSKSTDGQRDKIRNLILDRYHGKLRHAFFRWHSYTTALDTHIRMHVLCKDYATSKYLTSLFSGWRTAIFEQKRKRFNRSFHAFKAWRDYIA